MTIIRTSQIEQKIQEYKDHCLSALHLYSKNQNEHCAQDFRKSCEAFFKILIFSHYNDINGLKIVLGELDSRLRPSNNRKLLYNQLFTLVKQIPFYNFQYNNSLEDIQKHENDVSHEPNQT